MSQQPPSTMVDTQAFTPPQHAAINRISKQKLVHPYNRPRPTDKTHCSSTAHTPHREQNTTDDSPPARDDPPPLPRNMAQLKYGHAKTSVAYYRTKQNRNMPDTIHYTDRRFVCRGCTTNRKRRNETCEYTATNPSYKSLVLTADNARTTSNDDVYRHQGPPVKSSRCG